MAVIGTFKRSRDGGWEGTIRTLSVTAKARFVPNDNRDAVTAPDYRLLCGSSELGAAWTRRGQSGEHREYLSVQLDDPSLPNPISAALFANEDSQTANLVWNRRTCTSED
jgi:uncharacterized protein (DUF736 family)